MDDVRTVLSLLDLNPRKFGSMEEFVLVLSQRLRDRGSRSVLVFSEVPETAVANRLKESGSVCEILDWRWGWRFYRGLLRLLRQYRPEVVHLHFYNQFSLLPFLLKAFGVSRIIYTDHCRQPTNFGMTKRLVFRLWNVTVPPLTGTRFIAISAHIKRVLTDCFLMDGRRIRIILNGVNVVRFKRPSEPEWSQLRKRFDIPEDCKAICAAAALIPEKGITYLLQAARLVLAVHPKTVLLIAGDGGLAASLRLEATQLGISANTRFLGLISDVDRLMAIADVIIVPSIWQEPAGLVVIEGMASGKPVVATRVGGIPEYVEDGVSGILVEPRSAEQISAAIDQLLTTPQRADQIGRAAREVAESRLNIERWVSETLEMYSLECQPAQACSFAASE
jgi:glycosyltransferase involved in cell wall biosynthesis